MHAWLASLALPGGFSADEAIKFGVPLTGGITPLIVYWLCQRVKMPSSLIKYTIGASCLVIYPHFMPTGTPFSKVPLFMVLGAMVLREYYSTSSRSKLVYTLVALIGLAQLVIWHSTTPMVLPVILASISLTPAVVWLVRRSVGSLSLTSSFLRLALLAGIFFVAYHLVEADKVFYVLASRLWRFAVAEKPPPSPVPQRLFEVTMIDVLRVILVMHGRDLLVFGLMALGLLVIWRYRVQWEHLLYFYAYLLLICAPFGILLVTGVVGTDYGRLMVVPVSLATFFAALPLWWLYKRLPLKIPHGRWLGRLIWLLTLVVLIGVWTVQFFICQPLIPKAKSLTLETSDEYVVWLHMVNNAYQQRMLNFVESHTDPDTLLAIDYWGASQFTRYFGSEAAYRQGLYQPLHWRQPIDPTKVKLFLLHWPGPAGGLAEQVEYRSTAKLTELRNTPGWGLIYDNGESFVLQVR
jgi:hypothetical protein